MLYTNIIMYVKHISVGKWLSSRLPLFQRQSWQQAREFPLKGYGEHLEMTGVKVKGKNCSQEQSNSSKGNQATLRDMTATNYCRRLKRILKIYFKHESAF